MIKKKLVVHIGYPKTATTTLQLNLFRKLKEDGKIEYLNHLNRSDENFGNINCNKIVSYLTGQSKEMDFEDELERISKINKAITLLSNENLSFFHSDFSWAYSNSRGVENIQKILSVFKPYFSEIEFIIGIRAQYELIPSFYAQCLPFILQENPEFKNYKKWLKENFFNKQNDIDIPFNFLFFYNCCKKKMSTEHIHFLIFEDLKNNQKGYYQQIASIFNVEENYIKKNISKKNLNVTQKNSKGGLSAKKPTFNHVLTKPFRKILRKINPSIYMKSRELYHLALPSRLRNMEFGTSKEIRPLTPSEIKKINRIYSKLNKELIESKDLDLEKMKTYNYIN